MVVAETFGFVHYGFAHFMARGARVEAGVFHACFLYTINERRHETNRAQHVVPPNGRASHARGTVEERRGGVGAEALLLHVPAI